MSGTLHKVEWQGYNTKLAYDNIFIVVPLWKVD